MTRTTKSDGTWSKLAADANLDVILAALAGTDEVAEQNDILVQHFEQRGPGRLPTRLEVEALASVTQGGDQTIRELLRTRFREVEFGTDRLAGVSRDHRFKMADKLVERLAGPANGEDPSEIGGSWESFVRTSRFDEIVAFARYLPPDDRRKLIEELVRSSKPPLSNRQTLELIREFEEDFPGVVQSALRERIASRLATELPKHILAQEKLPASAAAKIAADFAPPHLRRRSSNLRPACWDNAFDSCSHSRPNSNLRSSGRAGSTPASYRLRRT